MPNQIDSLAQQYGNVNRGAAFSPDVQRRNSVLRSLGADVPDAGATSPDGTVRAGRGYDAFTSQSRTPYDVTNPDGSVTPAGGSLDQAPQWNQNTGPYGAYLNRLNTNTAAPDALATQTRNAIGANMQNIGPRQNIPANLAQANAEQSRALMLGAANNMGNAGSDFRNSQAGILGLSQAQAQQARGQQQGMLAGAGQSDAGSTPFQQNALGMYQAAAMGQGPSAAQAQLRSGLDQSIAAQHAMAAGVRGGGAAAAMRGANQAGAQMNLQAAASAAALRAQEQQAGMQGLANTSQQARVADQSRYGMGADILNQMRSGDTSAMNAAGQLASTGRAQDIGQSGQVADYLGSLRGQDIAAGGTFGQLALGQMQTDDQRRNASMQLGLEAERQRQAALAQQNDTNMNAASLMSGNYLQGRNLTLQHDAAQDQTAMGYFSGFTGAGGAGLQMAMPYLGGGGAANAGYGIGPSVDSALNSFDAAHQQPGMF